MARVFPASRDGIAMTALPTLMARPENYQSKTRQRSSKEHSASPTSARERGTCSPGPRYHSNRYQVIVFEDLQVANLVRAPKPKQAEETGQYLPNGAAAKGGLNKSILDAGWGMFVTMCVSKAEGAGRVVVKVDPHQTSQACSG